MCAYCPQSAHLASQEPPSTAGLARWWGLIQYGTGPGTVSGSETGAAASTGFGHRPRSPEPEPEPEPRSAAGAAAVNGSAPHPPTGVSLFSRGPVITTQNDQVAGRGKSDAPAASASVTESRPTPSILRLIEKLRTGAIFSSDIGLEGNQSDHQISGRRFGVPRSVGATMFRKAGISVVRASRYLKMDLGQQLEPLSTFSR